MKKETYPLATERLILRAWQESDATSLYKYAKDPAIGPGLTHYHSCFCLVSSKASTFAGLSIKRE